MRDSTKKIWGVIGVVLVLALAVFGVGRYNGFFSITGSSTLSLTQASLQSSNPQLNGQAWILTFSAGGLGQSYYGTITPSDVDAQTSDSSKTTKNLGIQVTYADESCQYPISGTGNGLTPIYDINQFKYTYLPLVSPCDFATASQKAGVAQSNILFVAKPSLSLTCNVVYKTGQSPVGSMGNGNVHAPYTITLNVDGNVASKTIDPIAGSASGAIGDYAYAVWNGNLVSGISCPASYNYQASYVNGNWRIINKQAYDIYINKFNQKVNYGLWTQSNVDSWVSEVQSSASQAKVSTSFGTISSSSSLSNAIVKVPLSSPLQFPVTTLYVKASTLGVYTPVPNIVIDSATSSCFKTGNDGSISVNLRNTGATGTYRVYAQCANPFAITQSATGSLDSGSSKTVYLGLSATATEKTQATCSVVVETTGGSKSYTANVCVDPQVTCTIPYPQKFCDLSGASEAVFQCSQNGATKSLIQTCGANEGCENGVCVVGANNNGGTSNSACSWYNVPCKVKELFSGIGTLFKIFRWFVLILAVIIAFIVGRNIAEEYLIKKRRDEYFAYILGIILALAVGILGYILLLTSLFWWISIGLIVIFIAFKILVKLFPLLGISRALVKLVG